MAEEREKILRDPEQLRRLYKIRQSLYGTDRDDHLEELNNWERKIKKSLIFLNLQGHEGITQLLSKADEEIAMINTRLLEDRKTDNGFSTDALVNDSLERQRLLDLRSVWMWFKSLFEEAKIDLKDAELFLEEQEKEEGGDDYVGN